ncbi:MAG: hypothetical protein ACE5E6_04060 [Phycisphaerae bacterium]
MQRILMMALPVVLSGCGAVTPPADPVAASDIEPVEETDAIRLHAGVYSGSVTCVRGTTTSLEIVTMEFDDSGNALGVGGLPLRVGDVFANSLGAVDTALVITSIQPGASTSRLTATGAAQACDNTCTFSFDGVCDETLDNLGFCPLGTDCFDCGPFVVEAFVSLIVTALDSRNARFLREILISAAITSTLTESSVCDGTITR